MKSRIIHLALALLATLAGLVMTSAPANAAALCQYWHCDGYGPTYKNCDDDGYKLYAINNNAAFPSFDGHANVQLMYSPACKALWARGQSWVVSGSVHGEMDHFDILIEKRRISDNVRTYYDVETIYQGDYSWDWTLMAGRNDGRKIRACFRVPGQSWRCTPYMNN